MGDGEVKTRVIRYWHETDWLYRVEKLLQITGEEVWVTFGYGDPRRPPFAYGVNKGDWYWAPVIAGVSRDRAMSVASRLADGLPQEDDDVIAEFGA